MAVWRTARRALWTLEAIPLIALYTVLLLVAPTYRTRLPVIGRH